MEDRFVLGVRDLWRVVIRPRRMRDGPVATNAIVEEGDGRFGIVGERFDTGYGNAAFKLLRLEKETHAGGLARDIRFRPSSFKFRRNATEQNCAETRPNETRSSGILLGGRETPNVSLHKRALPLWKAGAGAWATAGSARAVVSRLA